MCWISSVNMVFAATHPACEVIRPGKCGPTSVIACCCTWSFVLAPHKLTRVQPCVAYSSVRSADPLPAGLMHVNWKDATGPYQVPWYFVERVT